MNETIIKWLIARFSERSSAVALTAIVSGGWKLHDAISAGASSDAKSALVVTIIFGVVGFATHDGKIVDAGATQPGK